MCITVADINCLCFLSLRHDSLIEMVECKNGVAVFPGIRNAWEPSRKKAEEGWAMWLVVAQVMPYSGVHD